jgi:predicted HAD superfamily Cof-like phosphohydrolase
MTRIEDGETVTPLALVAEFYRRVGRDIRHEPTAKLPEAEVKLLIDLLDEEMGELRDALERRDLIGIADGLGDVVYVAYGAALQFGIDLDVVVKAIHEANMTKPNSDGTIQRSAAGKILRGDSYVPPALEKTLKSSGGTDV